MGEQPQQFASDNYSGICPQAIDAMLAANRGHVVSYGDDPWTEEVCDLFRELFETWCEVYFVFNGTAANSLALASLCQSYNSIICAPTAHVETDECGAPEFFSNGTKLLIGSGENGKLLPSSIDELATKRQDIHYPKPRVVSITQATEVGTLYSVADLQAVHAAARRHELKLHIDGARFANAVAALGVTPKEITWQCGVDVLCFGGTKNGLAVGEAVIFFNRELAAEFDYRCKQAGQLASKMRFLSAPWLGLLKDNVWLKNAAHANHCAALLEEKLREIEGVSIMFPRQCNSVFVTLPGHAIEELRALGWKFYTFIGVGGARFMCSWDTREERILALVSDIKSIVAKK
ncbi:MAG: threonine aldolase [Lentisphaerae bacterium GWF2_52_8]|nr:MAG: threonine aldolase [Lentisphaerae bacterium GWF2_52_8]